MSEREDLVTELEILRARVNRLAEIEVRLHRAFMAIPDDVAGPLGAKLDEICQELDDLSDSIGALDARLYLIDAAVARKSKIWDAAYYGGPT